jgi:Na+-driven multidrug efflux pump
MIVAGFGIAVSQKTKHFLYVHSIAGLMVFILLLVQNLVGIVIDRMYESDRVVIPIRDKIHWWLGRSVFVLAIVTVFLGVTQYGGGVLYPVAITLIVIVAVAFALGEFFIGQVNHFVVPSFDEPTPKPLNVSSPVHGLSYYGQ